MNLHSIGDKLGLLQMTPREETFRLLVASSIVARLQEGTLIAILIDRMLEENIMRVQRKAGKDIGFGVGRSTITIAKEEDLRMRDAGAERTWTMAIEDRVILAGCAQSHLPTTTITITAAIIAEEMDHSGGLQMKILRV